MDITNFVVSQRQKALLVGDYGSYRRQLSRRLLVVRRKLKYTSTKGRKYAARTPVIAEDIAKNHEWVSPIIQDFSHSKQPHRFIQLLLLTSERAWAFAMHMKSVHSADSGAKGVIGSTRRHICSRLHKASSYASQLLKLLENKEVTTATTNAILEARAYYISLCGAIDFEKRNWQDCLHKYSEARLIYSILSKSRAAKQEDRFMDLLNTTIDPSIRYAAYQLKLPRTMSIGTIVAKYVPRSEDEYVQEVLRQDPEALNDPATAQRQTPSGNAENVPRTIRWRSRMVDLEDAATAQALAAVSAAEANLSSFLSSNPNATSQAKASAYDEILRNSQDAVDATKIAIDELSAEGVPQGDRRMQALQITRTAVNYALVGWRIGRNRVLCGKEDGALFNSTARKPKKPRKAKKVRPVKGESIGRKVTRLREKVVLYDSTLQSLDFVKELPGVAADQEFIGDLEAKRAYFAALRCLAIARAHSLLQNARNALALLSRALDLSTKASSHASASEPARERAPNLDITPTQAKALQGLLQGLVFQYRALVELHNISSTDGNKSKADILPPLVERLEEYPQGLVDLTNLVTYPPKIEPIPVKPIFLDVAFNYIDYPGRKRTPAQPAIKVGPEAIPGKEEKREGKKGWFGFGR